MSYSSFKDLQLISRIDNNMLIDFMALQAEFQLTALSLVIYLRARISLFIVMLMTHSFTSKHSLICSLPYLHYDVLLIYKTGCHPSNYSRMRINLKPCSWVLADNNTKKKLEDSCTIIISY